MTPYDGGPTLFNVPMYVVLVEPPGASFSYILNGVLVGDHPRELADWSFIDPSSEQRVHPGDSAMPSGSRIRITVPTELFTGGFSSSPDVLRFTVSDTGSGTLLMADPQLVRVRQPLQRRIDNHTDLVRPRVIPTSSPLLVFERMLDSIPPTVDVHLADFPPEGLRPGVPLTRSLERTRLLDVSRSPDGTIHMLLTGERQATLGVFYARLDPAGRRLYQFERIAEGIRMVRRGRVVATEDGEIHAFWQEVENNVAQPYESGLYWSHQERGGPWGPAVALAPEGDARESWYVNDFDATSAVFDVAPLGNSGLLLVWAEPRVADAGAHQEALLASRLYRNGVWEERTTFDEGRFSGVHLATGSDGEIHLFTWARRDLLNAKGPLQHRTSPNGITWTPPETLDSTGTAAFASAAAGPNGRLDLVWERTAFDGTSRVLRRRLENGQWGSPQLLASKGAEKPTATTLPDGSVAFVWSVPTPSGTDIGWRRVEGTH
jgi:hypothetical protein